MPLTQFSIEKYLNGHPIQTRDGRMVTNLKEVSFSGLEGNYFTAIIDLKPIVWNGAGVRDYIYNTPDPLDLFMKDIPAGYKYVPTIYIEDTQPADMTGYSIITVEDLT